MKPNILKKSKIFDRVNERASLQYFLLTSTETTLLVDGESGSGKSSVVNTVLQYLTSQEERCSFCFAEGRDSSNAFAKWLRSIYEEIRFNRKFRLKDFRVNIPFLGTSAGFEFRDEEYTICYFENFISRAIINNIKVFYISNIELCDNEEREYIKCFLKASINTNLKIIVEQGTLPKGKQWINDECLYVGMHVNVANFNKAETEKLFKHIHKSEAPIEIFSQSRGNSLCIKHYGSSAISEPRLEWAKKLLDQFTR